MGGISEQEVNKHGTRAVILSFMSSLEELFWSCFLDVLMKLGSINGPNPAIILLKTDDNVKVHKDKAQLYNSHIQTPTKH
jgi:hypothetical protein